jgi:hypothetical protein
VFGDLVEPGYLPPDRARRCRGKFTKLSLAFRQLILPHIDKELARQVLDGPWLRGHPIEERENSVSTTERLGGLVDADALFFCRSAKRPANTTSWGPFSALIAHASVLARRFGQFGILQSRLSSGRQSVFPLI